MIKTVLISCTFLLSLLSSNVFSQEMVSTEDGGKWIVNSPDSRRIYAVQCGLDTTLFTLKYFDVDYSLERVSLALPLSQEGISLGSIQRLLSAYGLEVSVRKGASLKKIARSLHGDRIAIIPLGTGNGRNHYYVSLMDKEGIVQLVNVSRGVMPLISKTSDSYNKNIEVKFAEAGKIVLFVSKPTKKNNELPLEQSVLVTPQSIELGEFMIEGNVASEKIDASFQLINTTDKPILITSILTSCGCTQLQWKGGILSPGEEKEVNFSVIPASWGRGDLQKKARVSFVDGSFKDVTIHGIGQTPIEKQRIELSQYNTVVELDDKNDSNLLRVRLGRISSYVFPLDSVKISVDSPWVTTELVSKESLDTKETAELYATISTNDLQKKLESEDNHTEAVLSCSGDDTIDPVEMKIEFVRREFAQLDQSLLTISADSSESYDVRIKTESDEAPVRLKSISSEMDFILAKEVSENNALAVSIQLDQNKQPEPGYYNVDVHLENENGRTDVLHLTVHVAAP